MPDNRDCVALITGATSKMGRVTAMKLAVPTLLAQHRALADRLWMQSGGWLALERST